MNSFAALRICYEMLRHDIISAYFMTIHSALFLIDHILFHIYLPHIHIVFVADCHIYLHASSSIFTFRLRLALRAEANIRHLRFRHDNSYAIYNTPFSFRALFFSIIYRECEGYFLHDISSTQRSFTPR